MAEVFEDFSIFKYEIRVKASTKTEADKAVASAAFNTTQITPWVTFLGQESQS